MYIVFGKICQPITFLGSWVHFKMANAYILREPKCQNFVSVYRGFSFVGKTLEPHTRHVLEQVHQTIYNRLAGEPACTDQCSLQYGNNTGRFVHVIVVHYSNS